MVPVNILWLNSRIMFPLDQGGRIRTYHTLKHLSRRHNIAIVTLAVLPGEATAIPAMSRVCRELHVVATRPVAERGSLRFARGLVANLVSRWPYSVARYRSRRMRQKVAELLSRGLSTGPVDAMVCDFLTPAINLPLRRGKVAGRRSEGRAGGQSSAPEPRDVAPGTYDVREGLPPLVLFAHNVESVIWQRLAAAQTSRLRRAYFKLQAARMRRCEERFARACALVIAVSPEDRDTFRREYGVTHVEAVPTGVDADYFGAVAGPPCGTDVVFVGSMDWMPNEDAAAWLMREILPRVRQAVPAARLTVVGKSPSAFLRRLAAEVGQAAVTGRVDDVRPYLERARVVVVPLRVGGGTRIKIFEAMAARRPVVSTAIGAEGLPVTHGRDVLIADGDADFAEAVVQVLTDDRLAERLAGAGRELVEERFDWAQAADAFDALLQRAVRPQPERVLSRRQKTERTGTADERR